MDYKSVMDRDFKEALRLRDAQIQYLERHEKTLNLFSGLALIITYAVFSYEYSHTIALLACTVGIIGHWCGFSRCEFDKECATKRSAFTDALIEFKKEHPERFDEFGWYHYDGFSKFFVEL